MNALWAFWAGAAVLWGVVLWWLVRPLFVRRRARDSSPGSASASGSSSGSTLGATLGAVLLSVSIVGASAGLYLYWSSGYREAVAGAPTPPPDFERLVARLAADLERDPDDVAGWLLLASSHKMLGDYARAVGAYEQAASRAPLEDWSKVEYAEALFLRAGGRFEPLAVELLEQALAGDGDGDKGLWLLGMAGFQAGDYAAAIRHWQRLHERADVNPRVRDAVAEQIAAARARLDAPATPARDAPPQGRRIAVMVSIDPELRARASPDAVVFVYAKAASGPSAPLAVRRFSVGELPLEVYLGREHAMAPSLTLDDFDSLRVGARVSHSGRAAAAAGDFIGESTLAPDAGDAVDVHVDEIVAD